MSTNQDTTSSATSSSSQSTGGFGSWSTIQKASAGLAILVIIIILLIGVLSLLRVLHRRRQRLGGGGNCNDDLESGVCQGFISSEKDSSGIDGGQVYGKLYLKSENVYLGQQRQQQYQQMHETATRLTYPQSYSYGQDVMSKTHYVPYRTPYWCDCSVVCWWELIRVRHYGSSCNLAWFLSTVLRKQMLSNGFALPNSGESLIMMLISHGKWSWGWVNKETAKATTRELNQIRFCGSSSTIVDSQCSRLVSFSKLRLDGNMF